MTSKRFAQWVKEQRIKKGLSIKQFKKEFNKFCSRKSRSYQWFIGFEKYSKWAERELEMLSAMADFFGYRITILPNKDLKELTEKEKTEIQYFIESEKQLEEQDKELFIQKSIIDKNW